MKSLNPNLKLDFQNSKWLFNMADSKYLKWSDLNKIGGTWVSEVAESKSDVELSKFMWRIQYGGLISSKMFRTWSDFSYLGFWSLRTYKLIVFNYKKKACELRFRYCFLIDFTKFFLWESMLLDFGFFTEKALWIHRNFKIWYHDKKN